MATIDKKKQLVADLQSKLSSSKVAVFADYRGLNVASATALRVSFREAGAEVMVAKNTLTKIAADRVGIQGLEQLLTGPTIIAFGYADQTTTVEAVEQLPQDQPQSRDQGRLAGWPGDQRQGRQGVGRPAEP